MYLEHFELKQMPFGLTPNPEFYFQLPTQEAILNQVLSNLNQGDGFIKITGEVGTGKTLLCHQLLSQLQEAFLPIYIPNPDYTPFEFRLAVAQELGMEPPQDIKTHELDKEIHEQLENLFYSHQSVVLIIDEAQTMPDTTLETLRLITNLKYHQDKHLQIVLFGQPELDKRLKQSHFRQILQRIAFSYYLTPLQQDDIDDYICHRMFKAGYQRGQIFTKKARRLLYQASRGVPRIINLLGHKSLIFAFQNGEKKVSGKSMRQAIHACQDIVHPISKKRWPFAVAAVGYTAGVIGLLQYYHVIHIGVHI